MREFETVETFIKTLGTLGDFEGMLKAKWLLLSEYQGTLKTQDKLTFYNQRCLGEREEPYAIYNGVQKGFQDIPDFKLYTIHWSRHKLDRSTVCKETLDKIGITEIRGE